MEGLAEFSILALYGDLSTDAPLSKDHSLTGILKFYLSLPVAIFTTMAIWALIAQLGSMIYIPLSLGLASLLTLTGIFVTFMLMLFFVSRGIDAIEQEIRSLLKARQIEHKGDNPHKLIWHS